jgi:hypothetical protein
MQNTGSSVIPEAYRPRVLHAIDAAQAQLAKGESLPCAYLIGGGEGALLEIVLVDASSPESKDQSVKHAMRVATFLSADFVLLISEAWGLPPDQMLNYDAIIKKYGSLSDYPGHVDQAWFHLETRHGWFSASAPILPHPPSKRRRKLGVVSWHEATHAEGRLARILPKLPTA